MATTAGARKNALIHCVALGAFVPLFALWCMSLSGCVGGGEPPTEFSATEWAEIPAPPNPSVAAGGATARTDPQSRRAQMDSLLAATDRAMKRAVARMKRGKDPLDTASPLLLCGPALGVSLLALVAAQRIGPRLPAFLDISALTAERASRCLAAFVPLALATVLLVDAVAVSSRIRSFLSGSETAYATLRSAEYNSATFRNTRLSWRDSDLFFTTQNGQSIYTIDSGSPWSVEMFMSYNPTREVDDAGRVEILYSTERPEIATTRRPWTLWFDVALTAGLGLASGVFGLWLLDLRSPDSCWRRAS